VIDADAGPREERPREYFHRLCRTGRNLRRRLDEASAAVTSLIQAAVTYLMSEKRESKP
jgi:hypothetical protein